MDFKNLFLIKSVKKVLISEEDFLNRARIKILLVILMLSLAKVLVALPYFLLQQPDVFQFARVLLLLGVYIFLVKLLLSDKKYRQIITHIMVWMGLMLIWTNIFISAQALNIITLQFILMLVLSSFYLLKSRQAFLYTFLGILPAILYLLFPQKLLLTSRDPHEITSPGYEIIIFLNFLTIVLAHYLFSRAFNNTIADKEKLNAQLQSAVKVANNAAESKSEFLSVMSHELRTPLNSVLGITEIMLKEDPGKDQRDNLKILKFSADTLHSIINNILDYNKLESDKIIIEKIPVNLVELTNNICSGLKPLAERKGIKFKIQIDETLLGENLITDPTRIVQILNNLAGNAIKFTGKGSIELGLKVLNIQPEFLTVRFSVKDTGIGITQTQQELIFEPFTQASSSTTRNFGGTGLGLSIVKKILPLLGSKIMLESEAGKGSVFYFDLNLQRHDEKENFQDEDSETNIALGKLKILVAEDNEMNRILIAKVLCQWQIEPTFVLNGKQAVEEVKKNNYDVIFMDIHMPELNGYEATKAIRALEDIQKSSVKIIAVTASSDSNIQEKITAEGMDGFILKPFKINDIYRKLIFLMEPEIKLLPA